MMMMMLFCMATKIILDELICADIGAKNLQAIDERGRIPVLIWYVSRMNSKYIFGKAQQVTKGQQTLMDQLKVISTGAQKVSTLPCQP